MLTKKDIKNFTSVAITLSGKGIETKTFTNLKIYERISTELQIYMPRGYMSMYINYPTKKDQNNFRVENDKIICEKGIYKIEFGG